MTEQNNTNVSFKKIILKPRITEKSAILSEKGIYTFQVVKDANKNEIKKEFEKKYKIKPVKVNIAKTAEKKVYVRGRIGKKSGIKKVYVYLKKGDKIPFI